LSLLRRILFKSAICFLALAGLLAIAPGPVRAQPREIASYSIAVRLDAEKKTLQGSETITFLNTTSHPTQELYFHLYPNAFRGPDSTFMKESPADARRASAGNNWGGMDVTSLRLDSGEDLLPGASVDDTVMRVPLPRPLEPGQSLVMEAEFAVKLVRVIARSGYEDDHFTIGQWFPKLAVLTDAGWNAQQYHANSEFFADFGNYHVEITLPERFVVGASGVPAGEKSNGDGTKTLTFEAQDVHDFGWAANPTFKEARARVGQIEIRLLYQAAHEDRRDRFLKAAVAAVENFGRWYAPYPYPLLTVVDVPLNAGGGMEYPTFVTVETTDPPLPGILLEEQVTIHEIAHQWWYGMVADNEFQEAWLDEGFATYSTRRLVDQLYGEQDSLGSLLGFHAGQLAVDRGQYLAVKQLDPVVLDSWKFYDSTSYTGNVYGKAGLILSTVENYLGEEKMGEVMRAYFQRFAFRHPTSQDFVSTVRDVAGPQMDRFLQQALYSPAIFDYSADAPAVSREGNGYRSVVVARRLGDGVMPMDVVTTFQDGSQQRETWDGEAGWQRYEYLRPSPAVKMEVDPSHKLLLDTHWANNSYTIWFNAEAVLKRAADALWLMQGWLKIIGFAL
jgi:hypothetical protein